MHAVDHGTEPPRSLAGVTVAVAAFLLGALVSRRISRSVVENARLYREAERRRREAEILAELARALSASSSVDAILQRVAEGARELCGSDLSAIALHEPDSGEMVFRYRAGMRHVGGRRMVVVPGRGAGGHVLQTGRPVRSDTLRTDPRFRGDLEYQTAAASEGIVTVMVVPITIGERVEGLLYVDNRAPRRFTDHHEAVLRELADHASIALANRHRLEREQAARAEAETARVQAERASRAKDEFLAMLGHELRNPLGAIATAVAVLEQLGSADEPAARARTVIGRQVRHLSGIVDDLLDVARVTAGKITLHRRPVDLAELAARTLATLDGGAHAVTLDTDPAWTEGDEVRIQQVLTNLVGNALKYTPAGGRIAVRIRPEDGHAVIRVEDSGIGIPGELLSRVFDLFVQGERPLDRVQGGLGIGLTLVRRLVELHGGSVEARSDGPGQGSTFIVRLPLVAPSGSPAPVHGQPGRCRRRVLIVEDNDDARTMLRAHLELAGHEVLDASDGAAGLERALGERPEIALIDIGLPGLDGYELARRIRAAAGGKICLIALTGYGRTRDQERAIEAGFDNHLVKPVEIAVLERVLAASADGSEA